MGGTAWLFMGVPYSKSLLYDDEHQEYKAKYPDQFKYDYAVSREQKNEAGQKMYIQTKMAEYADELWEMMQSPKTHIYMCGLKGMESGMEECFSPLAEKAGRVEGLREGDEEGPPLPRGGLLRTHEESIRTLCEDHLSIPMSPRFAHVGKAARTVF